MRFIIILLLFVSANSLASCPVWPLVIAHRGASGDYPEHTEVAYWQAMQQGADFIEADLVPTKDHILISRHENELSQSTNVADLPQFASRKSLKTLDGIATEGWFSEDFTLAELRQLKARESKPAIRPSNAKLNDQYSVLTLAEIMQLVQRFEQQTGRVVGLYLETKHPTYFRYEGKTQTGQPIGIDTSVLLLQQLGAWQRQARNPVYIQSFEIANLRWMRQFGLAQYKVQAKLIQLIGDISGTALYPQSNFAQPWDVVSSAGPAITEPFLSRRSFHYGDLMTPQGLRLMAQYADGFGPWKEQWYRPQPLLDARQLHPYGLKVHPYTFRREAEFLPSGVNSLDAELQQLYQQGVDGVFTDNPGIAVRSRMASCGVNRDSLRSLR